MGTGKGKGTVNKEEKKNFLSEGCNKKSIFLKERTDWEGEDFSVSEAGGGAATDSIPGHIVWRCRGN